ncbi:MAG: iron-sulfur cluster assembly accessory protein [Candidatus Hydrogenedentota bacterium]|nr:MAG: iron-sulfur cluster assembly accessory protein [Candidatus Hydrogenedentota bacterium]
MVESNVVKRCPIEVTERALKELRRIIEDRGVEKDGIGLRLGVRDGGCSGFSYVMDFEDAAKEQDQVFDIDGVRIFLDPKAYFFLNGMTVDFEESLMNRGFVFKNPNAVKTCSCGKSFAV